MVGSKTGFDRILEVGSDTRRRIVLAALAEEQRPLTLHDLESAILEHHHQKPATESPGRTRQDIQASLHHVHVPKLEEAGIVEYDPERKLVKPTAQFGDWQPIVSAIVDFDPVLEQPVEP